MVQQTWDRTDAHLTVLPSAFWNFFQFEIAAKTVAMQDSFDHEP